MGVYDITGACIYDLPRMIRTMSESAPADWPRIDVELVNAGGKSLQLKWEAGEAPEMARARIAAQAWDYVVVQELYSANEQTFKGYATRFDDAIRKAGSKTILFATASASEHYLASCRYPDAFIKLNDMQIALGKERGIPVAAAGYAWMKYLGPNPSVAQMLDLYHKDKGHPGYKGSYIYACLLYAVITGKNPAELTSEFKNIQGDIIIGKDEAAKMQKAAWAQYLENGKEIYLTIQS